MKFLSRFLLVALLVFSSLPAHLAHAAPCDEALKPAYPRVIHPKQTFDSLVKWIHDEIIVKRKAPGLVVGISGTDSIVAFLAAAKAYELAGRPDRVAGIHFGPSEDMIDDNPNAASHLWFQEEVIPWLKKQAPKAQVFVDSSIDFRRDGLRWGQLMDWSVTTPDRKMRLPQDQFWVLGTINATEEALFNYSNVSKSASVQVLSHLWKSEILQLSKYLGAPEVAIDKSCEVDCACGRMRLPAYNIPEIDALLMVRQGKLSEDYVKQNIPHELRGYLEAFIDSQIRGGSFKTGIPYKPSEEATVSAADVLDSSVVAELKKSIAEGKPEFELLTGLVSEVIAKAQPNIASDLASTKSPNIEEQFPEMLALFGTPDLRLSHKKQMASNLFSPEWVKSLNDGEIEQLASLNSRIARYGSSFADWRFITKRDGDKPSVAVQFGMTRLTRDSDVLESGQDDLGPGFLWQDEEGYLEYRRAYLVVSNQSATNPVTLVLRNNSHYFGRDRLNGAAYVSFEKLSPEELQNIRAATLDSSGKFLRWWGTERITGVAPLLDRLDRFNAKMKAFANPKTLP